MYNANHFANLTTIDGEDIYLVGGDVVQIYPEAESAHQPERTGSTIRMSTGSFFHVIEPPHEVAAIVEDARRGNLFALVELTTDRIAFGPVTEIETETRTLILLDESRSDNSRQLIAAEFDHAEVFTNRDQFEDYLSENYPTAFAKVAGFNGNPPEAVAAG